MCYFSFLFCHLHVRVLSKHLWSLNSLLAVKRTQIHYNTLFTTAFSQLFAGLNNRIHVFESVFEEGLNGLCIVHLCSSVWQRILILIRVLQYCNKKRDEYCYSFTFFKALNEKYCGAHSVDTSVAQKWDVINLKLYPWSNKYKQKSTNFWNPTSIFDDRFQKCFSWK